MKEVKLEVGQVWIGKFSGAEMEILYVGNSLIIGFDKVIKKEFSDSISDFLKSATLKKPEPKLTKLVGWAHKSNSDDVVISGDNDKDLINIRIKKQIIVKDDQLYVVD